MTESDRHCLLTELIKAVKRFYSTNPFDDIHITFFYQKLQKMFVTVSQCHHPNLKFSAKTGNS